jgi:hypothetical protein
MTLAELLPAIRQLPALEKLRLIRILAEELRYLAKINCPFTPSAEWCNSIRRGTYPA